MNRRREIPKVLDELRAEFALAAQAVYDRWRQDDAGRSESHGAGGVCGDVADALQNVLNDHELESVTFSHNDRVHVSVVCRIPVYRTPDDEDEVEDDAYEIDIDPYRYETGGGYRWKKIAGVVFDPSDVNIDRLPHGWLTYGEAQP